MNANIFEIATNTKSCVIIEVWKAFRITVSRWCSVKKMFLKISQNFWEKSCAGISFLIKLQTWVLQLYQERDSDTGFSSVNYVKFLRASSFTEHLRLLLPSLINTWGRSTFNYQKSLREIQRKVSKFETRFGMTQLFGFIDEALGPTSSPHQISQDYFD